MNWRIGGLIAVAFTIGASCRVSPGEPMVTAIEPRSVDVDSLPMPVRIVGERLLHRVHVSVDEQAPAKVRGLQVFIGGLQADGVQLESATEITALVPEGLAVGAYDVEVALGDGKRATLEQAFFVTDGEQTSMDATTSSASTNSAGNTISNTSCSTGAFGAATPIWTVPTGPDYGPGLFDNGLLLVFSRATATGEEQLQWAKRATLDSPFGEPNAYDGLSGGRNSTAALSADQLRIIFMSDRNGSRDLWEGVRNAPNDSFGNVHAIAALNTASEEVRPWLSNDGLTLFFESNRDDTTGFDIWQTQRLGVEEPFDEPTKIAGVTTPLTEGSPSVTADDLHLFYLSEQTSQPGRRVLFESTRPGREQEFAAGTVIDSLTQYEMDGYAAVSSDGREVVFSSKVADVQQLWRALRQCQ